MSDHSLTLQPARLWLRQLRPGDLLPVAVLAALILFFALRADSFLSPANLLIMSGQAGILLLVALGATLVILMGSIDLSVGSIILLTAAILSRVVNFGVTAPILIILVVILVGALAGLVNGLIFTFGKVPSFIATLGTLSFFAGLGLTVIGGRSIYFDAPGVLSLSIGQWIPGVQNSAMIGLIALTLVALITNRTRFGLYIYAIGGNERVVRLSGIALRRVKILAFVTSGVTAALAGLLISSQLGSSGPSLGSTALLDSLAAIVVGGTALSGGVGGVGRTFLGVLIITVLVNGLNQMGVQDFAQTMIKGAVIVLAAIFTMASQRGLTLK
ncbi:ABC transporter permease [Rhodobacter sp. 24-YEA-8]|uniref:ABC transporter permease n=1 Tax=Rhodobacter sp. 24-YEA-8 TaxID=1884310 RepID=UPI000895719A|nr:ABC transporter permease [Rhodobacter sp. 24-YEA-8]SED70826.1 monosaccharide ABC transporter membrane protein, CUT2 family [Rhodobacter sp. 24-YEA-8]